jgi:transposase
MAEGVLNARKLYGEILAQGYPGKESKVREFVHDRRPEKEPIGSTRFETAAFRARASRLGILRLHHTPRTRVSALRLRHDAGLVTSPASVRFTISSDTTWFIRCHLHAFAERREASPSGCSTITSKVL